MFEPKHEPSTTPVNDAEKTNVESPSTSAKKQHAFLDLAKKHKWDDVRATLQATPALVNVTPSDRWSALHHAADCQDPKGVEMLLRFGADPLARNGAGQTPRDLAEGASLRKRLEVAEQEQEVQKQLQMASIEKPRTFTKQFAKAADESPMVGSRSAAYTRGDDVKEVLAGLKVTASDEKAVEAYGGAAETAAQFESLCKLITEGVAAGSAQIVVANGD